MTFAVNPFNGRNKIRLKLDPFPDMAENKNKMINFRANAYQQKIISLGEQRWAQNSKKEARRSSRIRLGEQRWAQNLKKEARRS